MKFSEKLTRMFFKLTSIQLSSTTPMSEESILDPKKLVRTSSLTTSPEENNYASSSEIPIELLSTSMSILRRKLEKVKEK